MNKKFILLLLSICIAVSLMGCREEIAEKSAANEKTTGNTSSEKELSEKDSSKKEDFSPNLKEDNQVYFDFFKGDITAVSDINADEVIKSGEEYTYDALINALLNSESTMGYKLSNASYAFIDCGNDGINEMALKLQFGGMDPVHELFILKYMDGAMHICANESGYYRVTASINKYGYITVGGSGGASLYSRDYSFVNGDGQRSFLYSLSTQVDLEEPVIPKYELIQDLLPEDYMEDNYASSDYYLSCNTYTFTEYDYEKYKSNYDEYNKTKFFTIVNIDGNDVKPKEEYERLYASIDVNVYTEDEAQRLIDEQFINLDASRELCEAEEPEWTSLSTLGIGTYYVEAGTKNDVVNMLIGNWLYQGKDSDDIEALYLEFKENCDFTMNIKYSDSYTAPGYLSGHIILDYNDEYRDRIALYVEKSNIEAVSEHCIMEYYLIDSYTINGNKATMILDDVSYVESFINVSFNDPKPVFEKQIEETAPKGYYYYLYEPEDDFYGGEDYDYSNARMPQLTLESENENEITDLDRWFSEVGISGYADKYTVDNYTYELSGTEGYGDKTFLTVYNNNGERLCTYDFHRFMYASGYEYNDFVDRSIHYALIKDDTLFVNYYHSTYADSCPYNGYLIGIDINTGNIKWKSMPLVSNSGNFVIAGDYIITGYGFTDEDDYISLINCDTGSEEQRIPLKKSPDYFAISGNKLYVRTYSYDLVYDMQIK